MIQQDIHTKRIEFWNQDLDLHPGRAVFWKNERMLLVADLHLGKASHFRRNGIPVPGKLAQGTLNRLEQLIDLYRPTKLVILGDLFHSAHNPEWELFGDFLSHFEMLHCVLVLGNHDILSAYQYEKFGIQVVPEQWERGPFLFCHNPDPELETERYVISGHIHPGVRLHGKGRQGLRLPCFYFGKKYGLLPAFGDFTGLGLIKPSNEDRVFVIAEQSVAEIGV